MAKKHRSKGPVRFSQDNGVPVSGWGRSSGVSLSQQCPMGGLPLAGRGFFCLYSYIDRNNTWLLLFSPMYPMLSHPWSDLGLLILYLVTLILTHVPHVEPLIHPSSLSIHWKHTSNLIFFIACGPSWRTQHLHIHNLKTCRTTHSTQNNTTPTISH